MKRRRPARLLGRWNVGSRQVSGLSQANGANHFIGPSPSFGLVRAAGAKVCLRPDTQPLAVGCRPSDLRRHTRHLSLLIGEKFCRECHKVGIGAFDYLCSVCGLWAAQAISIPNSAIVDLASSCTTITVGASHRPSPANTVSRSTPAFMPTRVLRAMRHWLRFVPS